MATKAEEKKTKFKAWLLAKGKNAIDAKLDNYNFGYAEIFKADFIAQVYELKKLCRGYDDFKKILNEVRETLSCDGEFDYLVEWLFSEDE